MAPLVIVAMSGGVDSSVAAALLKREGWEVIGVGMRLPAPDGVQARPGACCGMVGMADARSVAERLDIPFYVLDYRQVFERRVVAPFCQAYARGETPNPCIDCNASVKFGTLLEVARTMGADGLATGHYARLVRGEDGRIRLQRAGDRRQDQSYFLATLDERQRARAMFPLGDLTKTQVRRMAAAWRLPVADKPASQDICFVGQRGYRALLRERTPDAFCPGPVEDVDGRLLGYHHGLGAYTLGQRKGLGIAWREPLYVLALDAPRNTLVVGAKQRAVTRRLRLSDVAWHEATPSGVARVSVQARHRGDEVRAWLDRNGDVASVDLDEPIPLVAPGQTVVFYREDVVLGSGRVAACEPVDLPDIRRPVCIAGS